MKQRQQIPKVPKHIKKTTNHRTRNTRRDKTSGPSPLVIVNAKETHIQRKRVAKFFLKSLKVNKRYWETFFSFVAVKRFHRPIKDVAIIFKGIVDVIFPNV